MVATSLLLVKKEVYGSYCSSIRLKEVYGVSNPVSVAIYGGYRMSFNSHGL